MYNFNAKKLDQYLLKVCEGGRELAYDISHKINYTGSDIFAEVSNEQLCNKREMINQQLLYLYGPKSLYVHKSHGGVSPVGQDTIENVSWPIQNSLLNL